MAPKPPKQKKQLPVALAPWNTIFLCHMEIVKFGAERFRNAFILNFFEKKYGLKCETLGEND